MAVTTAAEHDDTLRDDTRGAVMIIGLFMAVLAVGFLYYLIGVGNAIVIREKMQDAADASAFSAAIVHARGMNILALINIIMAAVLAILVMLKLISAATKAAIAVLIGIAWLVPPVLGAVPPLRSIGTAADRAAGTIKPAVMQTLTAGRKLAQGVRIVIPIAAQTKVVDFATNTYSPPADIGFIYPIYRALPTVDDEFDRLCNKAGKYAGDAIAFPIEKLGGKAGKRAAGLISKFTGGMAETFAGYFCGKGGSVPQMSYEKKTFLPKLTTDASRQCDDPARATQASCDEATREIERAKAAYDYATGTCTGSDRAVCESQLRKARTVCHPKTGADKLKKWWWREQTLERVWELKEDEETGKKSVVLVEQRRVPDPVRWKRVGDPDKGTSKQPCMPERNHTPWTTNASKPVCEVKISEPSLIEFELRNVTEIVKEYKEVTDIIGCLQVTKEKVDMDSEQLGEGGAAQSPQGMCNCAELGEERFQIHAFILGDAKAFLKKAERGLLVANFGRDPGGESGALYELTRQVGRLSFAQAEFYYDGKDSRSEWLWHMYWKARMRRFHTEPSGWECTKPRDNCPARVGRRANAAFSAGSRVLNKVGRLILH